MIRKIYFALLVLSISVMFLGIAIDVVFNINCLMVVTISFVITTLLLVGFLLVIVFESLIDL